MLHEDRCVVWGLSLVALTQALPRAGLLSHSLQQHTSPHHFHTPLHHSTVSFPLNFPLQYLLPQANFKGELPLARNLSSATGPTQDSDGAIFNMLITAGATTEGASKSQHPMLAICKNNLSRWVVRVVCCACVNKQTVRFQVLPVLPNPRILLNMMKI